MNYESDVGIQCRLLNHYDEALEIYNPDKIVGIFLQGSQNYGLGTQNSDVDTKCIVLPTFRDICLKEKMVSYTHIRENNEHIDFKDLRLMFDCFRKQNINFIEILFTPYYRVNPLYEEDWNKLLSQREAIARYNGWKFVKSTCGQMEEKYKASFLPRPSQMAEVEEYGWSTKNVHHLFRFKEFLERYLTGEPYIDCLHSNHSDWLCDIKTNGHSLYTLEDVKYMGNKVLNEVRNIQKNYEATHVETTDGRIDELLDDVAVSIFEKSIKKELDYGD